MLPPNPIVNKYFLQEICVLSKNSGAHLKRKTKSIGLALTKGFVNSKHFKESDTCFIFRYIFTITLSSKGYVKYTFCIKETVATQGKTEIYS